MVSFTFVVVVVVDVSCERANIQQAVCSCGRTVTNRCLYPTIAHVFCRRTHQVVMATINSLCSHPTPSYKVCVLTPHPVTRSVFSPHTQLQGLCSHPHPVTRSVFSPHTQLQGLCSHPTHSYKVCVLTPHPVTRKGSDLLSALSYDRRTLTSPSDRRFCMMEI